MEESGGVTALVLELVEGPTLADRIAQGPIPLDEALPIAKQIVEALEAAHDQRIIHRDLKPANIKVRLDGTVKVLDFGLARAMEPAAAMSSGVTESPTITSPAMMTGIGVLLGTAAYMSPEQAKGRAADNRADIWAFGCVLYEMLAGRSAFEGDDVTEILGSIVKLEPAWDRLPVSTPQAIRTLLRRCLQKDRMKRLQHMGDARLEIVDLENGPAADGSPDTPVPAPRRERLLVGLLAVTTLAAVGLAIPASRSLRQPSLPALPEMRFQIPTPPTTAPFSYALSPDASTIVFVATSDSRSVLWKRRLDSTIAEPLRGTEGATLPFWSPDSKSVGFFADNRLKRVDLGNGTVKEIVAVSSRGASWNQDNTIVFAGLGGTSLLQVSADGGDVTAVANVGAQIRFPTLLPDGRHFTYWNSDGLFVGTLGSPTTKRLGPGSSSAVFLPPGFLLFEDEGILYAQRFNVERLELVGQRLAVASGIGARAPTLRNGLPVSASAAGAFAYRNVTSDAALQVRWFDRAGHPVATSDLADLGGVNGTEFELSPDGYQAAFVRQTEIANDIWVVDLARGVPNRFTTNPAAEIWPVWSPDSREIAFSRSRQSIIARTSSGVERHLLEEPGAVLRPADWSRDGQHLIYVKVTAGSPGDLWALPLAADGKPFPVIESRFDETRPQFSLNGRWISYESNDLGQPEIYVRPFNRSGPTFRVSASGGIAARWHPAGRELFFIDPQGSLMVVDVRPDADDTRLNLSVARQLFPTAIFRGGTQPSNFKFQYAVSADGTRFLINEARQDDQPPPITVVLNWRP